MREFAASIVNVLMLIAVIVVGVLVHQAGLTVMVLEMDGRVDKLAVAPGIQLYPKVAGVPWESPIVWGHYTVPRSTPLGAEHIFTFMGCIATAIFGGMALISLLNRKLAGAGRRAITMVALIWPLDLFSAILLPGPGVRQILFQDGGVALPPASIITLGLPPVPCFIGLAAVMLGLWALVLWSQYRRRARA